MFGQEGACGNMARTLCPSCKDGFLEWDKNSSVPKIKCPNCGYSERQI